MTIITCLSSYIPVVTLQCRYNGIMVSPILLPDATNTSKCLRSLDRVKLYYGLCGTTFKIFKIQICCYYRNSLGSEFAISRLMATLCLAGVCFRQYICELEIIGIGYCTNVCVLYSWRFLCYFTDIIQVHNINGRGPYPAIYWSMNALNKHQWLVITIIDNFKGFFMTTRLCLH